MDHHIETGASIRESDEVQDFLDRFERALTGGNTKTLSELWEVPAFVIGDSMVKVINSSGEIEKFFGGAKDEYNKRGISGTRAEIQRLEWISDNLLVVDVRWPYLSANGEELGEESSTYTLLRDKDGKLRLRSALMRGSSEPH